MSIIDLTTLGAVKSYGNFSGNNDALLSTLITAASRAFMSFTNRSDYIAGQTVKEIRTGTGTHDMVLNRAPVMSITSLTVGKEIIAPISGDNVFLNGYLIDYTSGLLRLTGGRFFRGCIVTIVYTYGYATVPEDIAQCINEMVLFIVKKRDHIDMKTQTLAAQITSYLDEFPSSVKEIVRNYKRRQFTQAFAFGAAGPPVLTGGLTEDTFTANGSTNIFTLSHLPTGGVAWFRNGMIQNNPADYTVSGVTVTTTLGPSAINGDTFIAIYT